METYMCAVHNGLLFCSILLSHDQPTYHVQGIIMCMYFQHNWKFKGRDCQPLLRTTVLFIEVSWLRGSTALYMYIAICNGKGSPLKHTSLWQHNIHMCIATSPQNMHVCVCVYVCITCVYDNKTLCSRPIVCICRYQWQRWYQRLCRRGQRSIPWTQNKQPQVSMGNGLNALWHVWYGAHICNYSTCVPYGVATVHTLPVVKQFRVLYSGFIIMPLGAVFIKPFSTQINVFQLVYIDTHMYIRCFFFQTSAYFRWTSLRFTIAMVCALTQALCTLEEERWRFLPVYPYTCTWKYKCLAHYIAKIVTEEETKEGNLDPTNYTRKIQNE